MLKGIVLNKTDKDNWLKCLKDRTCIFSTFYHFTGPCPSQILETPNKMNTLEVQELDPDMILYLIVSDYGAWYFFEEELSNLTDKIFMVLINTTKFKYRNFKRQCNFNFRTQDKIISSCLKTGWIRGDRE